MKIRSFSRRSRKGSHGTQQHRIPAEVPSGIPRRWTLILITLLTAVWARAESGQAPLWSYDAPDYVQGRFGDALRCDWVRSRIYFRAPGFFPTKRGTVQMRVALAKDLSEVSEYSILMFAAPARPHHDPSQMSITLLPPYERASHRTNGLSVKFNTEKGGSIVVSPLDWKAGDWHTLAVTWGDEGLFLYIDGLLAGSDTKGPVRFDEVPELISFGSGIMHRELSSSCWIDEIEISDIARPVDYIERFAAARAAAVPDAHTLALNTLDRLNPAGYGAMTESFRRDTPPGMQASSGYLSHNHLFTAGEPVRLPVVLFNPGFQDETFTISADIRDFYGHSIPFRKSFSMGAGAVSEIDLEIPESLPPGFYRYTLEGQAGDRTVYRKVRTFAVTRPFPKDQLDPARNRFGHHSMNMRKTDVFSRIGVGWERTWHSIAFLWDEIEPQKGTFDWRGADFTIREARKNGIEILATLGHPPGWAGKPPANKEAWKDQQKVEKTAAYAPRDLREFYDYVHAVVSRYKQDVKYWEIWNEPDWNLPEQVGFGFGGTEKEYLDVLRTAYEAAKDADPECRIVLGGMVPHPHLVEFLAREGGAQYFDVIGLHRYRAWNVFMERARILLKAGGRPKEIWQTERVTDDAFFAVTEIRDALLNGVDKYFFFSTRVYFSLEGWMPKEQYVSTALCVEKFHPRTYSGAIRFAGENPVVQGLLFDRDRDTQLAALFAPGADETRLQVRVEAEPQSALTLTHYMGRTERVHVPDGDKSVTVP
ncbi:MAG: endo-1,4-beta-xylanase, partial [Kiritimatiellia bacterium]|nr:endo-1,4-beta-xylanase [Kiritimatiellia bacterium]